MNLVLLPLIYASSFDFHFCFKVELCERRASKLLSGQPELQRLRLRDIFKIKGGLAQKFLTYVIKNMYADLACTGLKPGEELRVSIFWFEGIVKMPASFRYLPYYPHVSKLAKIPLKEYRNRCYHYTRVFWWFGNLGTCDIYPMNLGIFYGFTSFISM
jgi:hypothetical protein